MTDNELLLNAVREARIILARHMDPNDNHAALTINKLMSVLDRPELVEAIDRLEVAQGRQLPY